MKRSTLIWPIKTIDANRSFLSEIIICKSSSFLLLFINSIEKIGKSQILIWNRSLMKEKNISHQNFENKIKADRHFDSKKLEWQLQLAINQLPEKQRTVFNLRYYDEMPYEEMSKVLGTTTGALKASYHHAAKKVEDYILKHA